MSSRIQLRRGAHAAWAAANPVLLAGEPGYETDTGVVKFGDATTAWTSLPSVAVVRSGSSNLLPDFYAPAPTGAAVTDTANLAALVAAIPVSGGTIHLQPGVYNANIVLDGLSAVIVQGVSGVSGGLGGTVLQYTGTAVNAIVSAHSSQGIILRDLTLQYTNGGFAGAFVDFSATGTVGSAAGRGTDTQHCALERVLTDTIGSLTSAQYGVLLDNTDHITIRESAFLGAKWGIYGIASASTHANAIAIEDNLLGAAGASNLTTHIRNVGNAWSITGNDFEPLTGGKAGAIANDAGITSVATSITGNWFGDISSTGTQIQWGGSGLRVEGNLISGSQASSTIGLLLNVASSAGIIVKGNVFSNHLTGISITAACSALDMRPNVYQTVTNNFTANQAPFGQVQLAAGTATVACTQVTSLSQIALTRGGVAGALGHLSYSVVNQTSFTITSSSNTETSFINYEINELTN